MVGKAMAPAVQLRAAVALAGRFPALAGVDLSVQSGEVVLVVGANGAGKTSLLRACAGLLPVTSGEAWVVGGGAGGGATPSLPRACAGLLPVPGGGGGVRGVAPTGAPPAVRCLVAL